MASERSKPVMIGETTPRYVGVEEAQKKAGIHGMTHSLKWSPKTLKLRPLVVLTRIGFTTRIGLVFNGMIGKKLDYRKMTS